MAIVLLAIFAGYWLYRKGTQDPTSQSSVPTTETRLEIPGAVESITGFPIGSDAIPVEGARLIDRLCVSDWPARMTTDQRPLVIVVGGVDRLPLSPQSTRRFGDAEGLARARAERVVERLKMCTAKYPPLEGGLRVEFLVIATVPGFTPPWWDPAGRPDDRSVTLVAFWRRLPPVRDAATKAQASGDSKWDPWVQGVAAITALVAIFALFVTYWSYKAGARSATAAESSAAAATTSANMANSANDRARSGNIASTYTILRERFGKLRDRVPWEWVDENEIHEEDKNGRRKFGALVNYWRFAFDEWYITQELNRKDLEALWELYCTAYDDARCCKRCNARRSLGSLR